MGGFFVRKMAGAAAATAQLQKLFPLLVVADGVQWNRGHYVPVLATAVVANVVSLAFYASYLEDFAAAKASELPLLMMALLSIEALVIGIYLFKQQREHQRAGPVPKVATAMTEGKTPASVPSRIVSKTVAIVSSTIAVLAGRDLFFPGTIFELVPRDDVYLEWTGSLIHSPPEGSTESRDHGLESPLYVGDKFVSQLMALNLLILCLYKFVTAFGFVRYGSDGSGMVKSKLIWQVQAIGDAALLFVMRLFVSAAKTASLDLRWHVMALAYETFILGMYGFL